MGIKYESRPEAIENALIGDKLREKEMRDGSAKLLDALIANNMIARPARRAA